MADWDHVTGDEVTGIPLVHFFLCVRSVLPQIFQYLCRTIRSAGSLDSRLLEFYCTLLYHVPSPNQFLN
jgi:hypothetical protein